jgi:hypothetical protein
MKRSLFVWLLAALLGAIILVSAVNPVRAQDDAENDGDADTDADAGTKTDSADTKGQDDVEVSDDDKAKEEKKDETFTGDEEVEDDGAADIDKLKPSPDIITTVHFPEFPDKKFPLASDIQVLVGVHNKGRSAYNVTFVAASLHSPFDFNYVIQNFSARAIGEVVDAGGEQTFDYTFRPDKNLEPLEFWLSAFIIYNNTESALSEYQTFFYNGTIELVERPSDLNVRRVFTYFLAVAAAGLVGYIAFHIAAPSKSSSASATERGTREEGGAPVGGGGGWVPERVYAPAERSRVVRSKRDKKPAGTPKAKPAPADASATQSDS